MEQKQTRNKESETPGNTKRRTWIWAGISAVLAVWSVWAVLHQSSHASLGAVFRTFSSMQKGWLLAAVACVLGFIAGEACAIRQSLLLVGASSSLRRCGTYAAADIYFSAITPSASGGQPASAVLMIHDGLSAANTAAALLINLSMYACSLVAIGLLCLLTRADLLLRFGTAARCLIAVGFLVQIVLAAIFLLLFQHETLLLSMGAGLLHILGRLRLLHREEALLQKLQGAAAQYQSCLQQFADRKRELWKVFLFNLLQRASQIAVPMCVYMALGGGDLGPYGLWALQSFVLVGANYIPIPGGMGVTDYLMLNGFSSFFPADQAVSLELLSRSLSFYFCILLCGFVLLLRLAAWVLRRKETAS